MKTVLITGANGGIGKALCKAFKEAGYCVIGADLTEPTYYCSYGLAFDLEEFVLDITVRRRVIDQLRAWLPDSKLHVLVNNAAVQILGGLPDIGHDDWERSFRVNVSAPLFITQAFISEIETAQGCIINIGSIHARLTKPGFVTYAATKAALEGLTRSLAVDLGPKARVVAISPAAIRTPMLVEGFGGNANALRKLESYHPVGKIGTPEEVADAALAVAQMRGSFLTGATIQIDGGIGARLHDPGPGEE